MSTNGLPNPNTVGDFSIGVQRSIVVVDNSTGIPVDFGGDVLDYTITPIHKEIEINPISTGGYDKYRTDRGGWRGGFTLSYAAPQMDTLEAAQELLYHTGFTEKTFTILETTYYGSTGQSNTMQISGVRLKMDDGGPARKDSAIEIKMSFRGQDRQPA
jgi:hypothetical protein